MHIFIRAETYGSEARVALIPADIAILRANGFKVTVESSKTRAFKDSEYGHTKNEKWYDQDAVTLIIGLKELDHLEKLNGHKHIYFAHCYKNQLGAATILNAFAKSQSILYDLEYFRDQSGKRVLAFGFYAGMVGAALGLRQHYNQAMGLPDIADLTPWGSYQAMMDYCKFHRCRIAIKGKGRCSLGVQHILSCLGIAFDLLGRDDTVNYDILFNCILLDPSYDKVWIGKDHDKPLLIVDVSCDYTRPNNPLPVYSEGTTWQTPVLHATDMISVIAIDNLPSLLPRESSTEFSALLTELLLRFGDPCWAATAAMFQTKLHDIE